MKHLRFGAFLLPFFLIGCAETLSQINPRYKPVAQEYFLPATIERVEFVPTGTTRKIPLKEYVGTDCRTVRMIDAQEITIIYHFKTDHYGQRLTYEKLSLVATAPSDEANQRVLLKVAQYQDGSLEVTGLEPLR